MSKRNNGLLAVSVMFTLSFGAALAGCGGGGHNPTLVERKDPTCTEAGYEQYYLCSHCDKLYSDEEAKNEISAPVAIAALGHDMTKHDEDEATCTHPGNVEYYTCSREPGVYYADQAGSQTLEEIGVTVEHDLTAMPAIDPTKDEFGRKSFWECGSCHTKYADAYGDKAVTDEELRIDKIQETIDGELTDEFYHADTQFAYGAANVREGGLGAVVNATLAKDGVYFHVVANYNTPAAEQGGKGCVKIYINARNVENKNLPGNAVASATQAIIMELYFDGTIPEAVYQHNPSTVRSCETKTNEAGAPTKYTTTWEVYCSFESIAAANKSVLQGAFEKQDGKTVLKTGYNLLVTSVGCVTNKEEADKFENNGSSSCAPVDENTWFLWGKNGYFDWGADQRYMIVTPDGFSEDFVNVASEYQVKIEAENATVSGLTEKIAADGLLSGTVSAADGYVLRGLTVNGKSVAVDANGAFSVALADLELPWNTANITVTPVVIKNETQTVAITVSGKTKEGTSPLAGAEVLMSDGIGEPVKATADANGVATFENLFCTSYRVWVNGYRQAEITVTKGTGTASAELTKIFALAGSDNVTVDDLEKTVSMQVPASVQDHQWRGNAEIVTDSALATANVALETTLKISDVAGDWGFEACNQRLAIQLTKGGKGFLFWMWRHGGVDKSSVGAFKDGTLNDCYESAGFWGGDAEPSYAWIYLAAQSESGLDLRVVRNGETLVAYAKHGDEWEKLGETACGADDELQVTAYFGHATFLLSKTTVTDLGVFVEEQAPVAGTSGHIAHFKNGEKYYLPDGTPTTAEDIKTEVEASTATLTLVLKGLDGNAVAIPEDTEIKIASTLHNGTLTAGANGALSGTVYVGEYTASLYGYKDATLTVTANGAITLTMNATIAYGSDNVTVNDTNQTISMQVPASVDNTKWRGNAEIVTDGALNKANVALETTLKMSDATNWIDDNYDATIAAQNQRFAIQLTKSGKGFAFWMFHHGSDLTAFGTLNNKSLTSCFEMDGITTGATEPTYGWIYLAAISANGLDLRVVRNGETLVAYAKHGEVWEKLGETTCEADDELQVKVYFAHATYELSGLSAVGLGNYVAEQLPEIGTPGHIAHFVNGENYYLPDGTPTTADAVKTEIKASTATITLVLKDLKGNAVAIPEGTKIAISSTLHSGTLTAGADGVLSGTLCAGVEYTVSLYGYNDITFTVEASGTATLTMNATLGYASNDNVIVNDKNQTITIVEAMPDDKSYAGSAEVVVDSALKNANVLFETTVKAKNFEDGWTYKTTMQRFMIQMTESGKGIFFWTFNSEGNKANIQEISSFTNREENKGKDLNGLTEKERGWIVPLIKSADGLKLRIVRNGDTIALFAYNGTDWVGIGNMKCEANDNLKVVLYGTGCGWEFSEMSVSAADNTEYVLNATVTGTKAGVTTNLDEGATVRFTNLLGYDKTFTVGANGTIGDVNEKLPAGEYTVTVSGNSYAVFHKKIYISADVTTLAFDYEKFTVVVNSGSYDRYDFSHVEGDNSTIAVNDAVERFNVLSTDTYDNVSVTLGGKFDNSTYSSKSQGIFIKFEDGKYMFLRFDFFNGSYKIAWMGGDTWDLPRVQDWGWDDIHLMDEAQTQKWTSNQEMKLQLVREGKTLKVYLDGVLYRTNELNEEYADDKVQVGFFAWDAAEDASWNFEISEELPEA